MSEQMKQKNVAGLETGIELLKLTMINKTRSVVPLRVKWRTSHVQE